MTQTSENNERAHKALARMGLGSRRKIEDMISAGLVSSAKGKLQLGDKVKPGDRIFFDGRSVVIDAKPRRGRVFLLNKPSGYITSHNDPKGRDSVVSLLPSSSQDVLKYVGRLDINTTGVLLFTDDGDLSHSLTHPKNQIQREYLVRIHNRLEPDEIERLTSGIKLDNQLVRFEEIVEFSTEKKGTNHWYAVCLVSGVNRSVRRLMEATGHTVSRLKRVRFGPIFLPKTLEEGNWSELSSSEVDSLYEAVEEPNTPVERPGPKRAFQPRNSYRRGQKLGGKGRIAKSHTRRTTKRDAAVRRNERSNPPID